jgi:hypothetical protein
MWLKGAPMRYVFALVALLVPMFAGCEAYSAPGERADFSKLGLTTETVEYLTDSTVQQALDKRPLVTFPASIAVVRVQGPTYNSYSYNRYYDSVPRGAYSVLTIRDIEKDSDFEPLSKLPRVQGVGAIKRILLDKELNSDLELRAAAAKLNANLLLFYTLDTVFTNKTHIAPLTVITLGVAPNAEACVTCTASSVLMDTRNGYIYAVAESTAADNQIATAWTSADAMDEVRQRTERQAFVGMIDAFTKEWPNVVRKFDKAVAAGN